MKPSNRFQTYVGSWVIAALFASCSTAPKAPPEEPPAPKTKKIDYAELQDRLSITLGQGETGFRERRFNACNLGDSLAELQPPLPDCQNAYFTLIRFQLSCRGEESPSGVITESDLTPIANQILKFTLDRATGSASTNERGEGVIRAISSSSLKRKHLKISNGVDFLMIRANEITAIATPPEWCR